MLIRLMFLLLLMVSGPIRAEEPLPPEQAFRFSARAVDAKTIEASWQITDQYYMYRDKFKFALEPAAVQTGTPQFPPGKVKQDEFFGDVETYRQEVVIRLPFTAPAGLDAVTLKATSQGCADIGVCYPPNPQTLQVALAAMSAAPAAPTEAAGGAPEDESSKLAGLLKNAGFWLILTTFFGAGMLLALTPCVFPMYPILSGIIVGHGHAITKGRAFILSMAYVLGMAVTYAAAGVAAGLSGSMLSAALQNAWVLGAFALVFVVLSLSMFGFYELQLPAFLQSKLSEESGHVKGGSLHGVAADGRALGADRRPLRGGAAGRRAALHRADARRGARRRGAVRHGAGQGRAAGDRRRVDALAAAAYRAVDGFRQEILRRDAAGAGDLAGLAGAAGLGPPRRLGRAGHRLGDLPARPRSAAAACARLGAPLEGHR
jgi:thiol:disulfide interchange protein DsbD